MGSHCLTFAQRKPAGATVANDDNGSAAGGREGYPNILQRAANHFQAKSVSGLLELLPIIIPIVIIAYVVGLADSAVVPLLSTAVRNLSGGDLAFPQFWGVGLVLTIILFYLVGVLASTRVGKTVVGFIADVLGAIPMISSLYGFTRRATTVMTSQFSFSRAVFLEWPREGMVALGFVTARVDKPGTLESLAIVYIPTVPNPTSGNMALVAEDDLYETDLSVEDAMKLVFSGGIVPPDALSLGRLPLEHRVQSTFTGEFETDVPD